MEQDTKPRLVKVKIWTDGSCYPNPGGPGGWACILEARNGTRKELSGHMESTTNNRAEVTALIEALKRLTRPCEIEWVTDSEYAITCLNDKKSKAWRKAANKDLILELKRLVAEGGHVVKPRWIKGHNGESKNERCDELAEIARKVVPVEFAA